MKVSMEEIGALYVSFMASGCADGAPCAPCTNGYVEECEEGEAFFGIVHHTDPSGCAVQVAGFVTVPYSGTAPQPGYATLAADGAGGVEMSAGGQGRWVVAVDTAAQTVTFKL
ncbi:MAG: hypothetical protein LUH51_05785 [Firmicutes bacterium]|nr:hypothetical protein [Bacillota bacterium]